MRRSTKMKSMMVVVFCVALCIAWQLRIFEEAEAWWKRLMDDGQDAEQQGIDEVIHIALVSCAKTNYNDEREKEKPTDQSITMMKSAVIFSQSPIHFHIFTEPDMRELFQDELGSWPREVLARVNYTIRDVDYDPYLPPQMRDEWRRWYKPCGSFRLFLPMALQEATDALVYCDSDVVFVQPVERLWAHLRRLAPRQAIAVAPTSGHPLGGSASNEYMIRRTGDGDDVSLYQINSGVLLFDIRKMLDSEWRLYGGGGDDDNFEPPPPLKGLRYGSDFLLRYYVAYQQNAEHDQKLLNIIFHYNPERVLPLSCRWNFKHNFCTGDDNTCPDAESGGAGAVHGISSAFFGDVNPTFRALYEAFLEHELDLDQPERILERYEEKLRERAVGTFCWRKSHVITTSLAESIRSIRPG